MDMKFLKTFSTCLVVLAVHGTAWAEIYETTDAQGNPDFTDSPADADAEVVNLPETNIADAPQEPQPQTVQTGPAPAQENNTVIIHDNNNDGYDDGVYGDDLARQRELDGYDNDGYDDGDELARQRELDGMDRVAPGEVGNPRYDAPREVGDSEAQMPREVGDSEAQMPREVGDAPDVTGAHRR
jgi:hypothetical protein